MTGKFAPGYLIIVKNDNYCEIILTRKKVDNEHEILAEDSSMENFSLLRSALLHSVLFKLDRKEIPADPFVISDQKSKKSCMYCVGFDPKNYSEVKEIVLTEWKHLTS